MLDWEEKESQNRRYGFAGAAWAGPVPPWRIGF